MPSKLTKLRVKEISGVDDPANELPGWIVAKSKKWDGELEDFEKSIESLHSSLTGDAADLYFKDAPDDVVEARELIAKHIGADLDEGDETDSSPAEPEAKPAQKRRLRDRLRPGVGEPAPAPGEVEKSAADEEPSDEPVLKASDVESEVRKAVEAAQEEVAKAVVSDLGQVIRDSVEPLREAVAAIADRTENLEKHAARPSGLRGQDFQPDEPVEKDARTSLRRTIGRVASNPGEKVSLGG